MVQFCESYWKKFISLSHGFFPQKFHSLSHIKKFNSLSHSKIISILWDLCKKSSILIRKSNGSIPCVKFKKLNGSIHKKIQFCGSDSQKINSVSFFSKNGEKTLSPDKIHFFESNFFKKVQVFESFLKEGSILWVKLSKKKVQFFESHFQKKKKKEFRSIVWVISKKGSIFSILWVFFKKKKEAQYFKSLTKIEFCGANFQKKAQILESYEKFNSLSHVQKGIKYLSHCSKKVNSLGHIKKGFKSSQHFENFESFESYWKSSSEKNVQFSESYVEKGSILWVKLKRMDPFCESY